MAETKEAVIDSQDAPQSEAVQAAEADAAHDLADASPETLKSRISELADRLAAKGRTEKQIKKEVTEYKEKYQATEAKLQEAVDKVSKWEEFYFTKVAPEQERAQWERTRTAQKQSTDSAANAKAQMWESIAEEDNPKVKAVLTKAAKSGDFLSKSAIAAIRESFADDSDDDEKEDKAPPKITSTRSQLEQRPSLEQELANLAKRSDMTPMEKATEALAIKSQIAARDQRRA